MRIGILTGGGDCPGLNAVIRAVTKSALIHYQAEVIGFRDGFRGLVDNDTIPLHYETVSNILNVGGTILGSANRERFFGLKRDGTSSSNEGPDRTRDAAEVFRHHKLDRLVCIGGDGTLRIAHYLAKHADIPVIGVPKTIDNDVAKTDMTFGFDSAVTTVTEAIDKLHTTARSHHRVMVVEVMGRTAGWIALYGGVAGGGDILLLPEVPFSTEAICNKVLDRNRFGKRFSIVVAAEGAFPQPNDPLSGIEFHKSGGIGQHVTHEIEKRTGISSRVTVLGHLQRGGSPTPFDRILGTRYGYSATEAVIHSAANVVICLNKGEMIPLPIEEVAGAPKLVPVDHPLLLAAQSVGSSIGL
ncbi:MAG: ATP-dependent 6-phosphofructokinase [Verrucomicrobiota bacterium]|nr:ATP-dependent 6-phosphofructokinase [Verrucomicrobiota bacterium]